MRASQDSIPPTLPGGILGVPKGSQGFLGVPGSRFGADSEPICERIGNDFGTIWGRFGADQVTPIGQICFGGFHWGWASFTCSYENQATTLHKLQCSDLRLCFHIILRILKTVFFEDSWSRVAVFTEFRRRLRAFLRNLHFDLENSLFFDEDFHEHQAKTSHSCSVASCDRFCVL